MRADGSIYRLVSGQRASLEKVPAPRDRLSLVGQSDLVSWWFVPDHTHGTSSSILLLRYNRLALAVTWNIIFDDHRGIVFGKLSCMVPKSSGPVSSARRVSTL